MVEIKVLLPHKCNFVNVRIHFPSNFFEILVFMAIHF